MPRKYDIAIVGAGIGGLICGAYLAKAGLSVLIVEKNDKAGGCCVSFYRKGIRFDAGAHIFGGCQKGGVLYNILKRLDITLKFENIVPTERYFFSHDIIEVPLNIHEYAEVLKLKFSREHKNIDKYFDEIKKISKNVKLAYNTYKAVTYQAFLDSHFKNNKLKAVLSAQMGYVGLIPRRISVVAMAAMMVSYLNGGSYYPVGGAQEFTDSLTNKFKKFGGKLILGQRVEKFLKEGNNVVGIKTAGRGYKKEYFAATLVSNIDITNTIESLLGKASVSADVNRCLNHSIETPSLFILYLAVKMPRETFEHKMGWYYENYDINHQLMDCLYLSSPTLYDSSAASGNINVIEAFKMVHHKGSPSDNLKNNKKLEDKLLHTLEKIIPELPKTLKVKISANSHTIERYTYNRNGAAYGWSLTPGQFERNVTIVEELKKSNIFVAGHWTNPGGGILAVAISGYTTARSILMKRNRRRGVRSSIVNSN